MRNDARNQYEINGPVAHGLICDIDIATYRVSRGRQFEITHLPALCWCNPRRPPRKNGVNLRSIKVAAYRGIGRRNTPNCWTRVSIQCPRMGWTGRAPAPNRSDNDRGLEARGAHRHV